jgi:hypothetical protein
MSSQHLYDTDFYAWTQDQAQKLREVRDTRLDAEHLAEEVADLGRSELRAVTSHLKQMLVHLLKIAYSSADAPQAGWLAEARMHRDEALSALSPSMMQRLDLARIWSTAGATANDALAGFGEPAIPQDLACPFTLDELLSEDLDLRAAVSRLTP